MKLNNQNILFIARTMKLGGKENVVLQLCEILNVNRVPKWMSEHGLEWFYRFLQEPKRMFKRYFVDDVKILKLVKKYG